MLQNINIIVFDFYKGINLSLQYKEDYSLFTQSKVIGIGWLKSIKWSRARNLQELQIL